MVLQVRISARLAQKKKQIVEEDRQEVIPQASASTSEVDGLSSGAKRNRKYRQKIKEDPLLYKQYRQKENERLKKQRQNKTEEQKAVQRERSRKNVQKWRQKQKDLGLPTEKPRKNNRKKEQKWRQKQKDLGLPIKKPKFKTKKQVEERREKDRIRQQKYRARLKNQPQARGWIMKNSQKKLVQAEAEQVCEQMEQNSQTYREAMFFLAVYWWIFSHILSDAQTGRS